ncbi:MAG: AAA family ATPase [Treponema sp.]|jgi:DNA sulfur modification protein DndD|nr:AAA family ATPase [Treponema sp.]
MIRRLHLESFGKFTRRDFDFSPVTLFFGENEAGKTTLFDALFDGLCGPRGSTKNGKRLAARYGSGRAAAVEFEDGEFHPDEADFLNLFAVRSGDITLEVETNSRWMNKVKAALFSGGIDPQNAADRLDDMLRARGRASLNGEAAVLREEMERTRQELDGSLAAREEYIAGERQMEDRQREMDALKREAALRETEIAELEAVLEQQRLIAERRRFRDILSDIAAERRGAEELEACSRYSDAGLAELERREEELRNLRTAVERAESAEKETARRIEELAGQGGDREREKSRAERIRIAAGMFRGELVPREKFIRRRRETFLRKIPLVPASVLALAGMGALVFPGTVPSRFFLAGGLLLLSLIFFIVSVGRRNVEDPGALDEALGRIRAAWRQETGEELPGSYDEALAALDRAAERSASAAAELERKNLLLRELETAAADLESRRKEAERNRAAAAEAFRASLDGAAAADLPDYARKLGHRQSLEKRQRELEERLSSRMARFQALSLRELEDRLREKVREADGRITGEELSAEALQARENLCRDKKAALEALRRREKEWIGSYGENRGALRERFRQLPGTIARCEALLARDQGRLDGIKRDLRACEIARDIYRSLTGDADTTFRELSKEIGETFSLFTGGRPGDRPVDLKSWSPETARITDAGGSYREGDQLSAGTRDAFILASRLVLARKSLGEGERALIVLDEPFIALDRTRSGRALGVLKEFHQSSRWQLVFFTKDEAIAARAREVFGPLLLVHDLEV